MHIGSLLVLEVPPADQRDAVGRLTEHLDAVVGRTPLLRRLVRAPLGFDSDVWVAADDLDLADHISVERSATPLSDRELDEFVARQVMTRLDLGRAPFAIQILDPVHSPGGGASRLAVYIRVHHALTDGVGFQSILGLLSDDAVDPESIAAPLPRRDELPDRHEWLRASRDRFRHDRLTAEEDRERRRQAQTTLRKPALQRAPTPECALSGPTSNERAYSRVTLPFGELREIARRHGGTINDLFLALAGTAVRELLLARGELPSEPITTNSARSYRRPEHGLFGNRIVAIHPHVATHLADPIDRLRAIQASMAIERARTPFDEALLNPRETPFGPAVRRHRFAGRRRSGGAILPGNISVSNVPGPDHERSYGGFRQLSNHPTPLLGSGRALNFTARRNADCFDVGVMADPAKVPDVIDLANRFEAAYDLYRGLP